MTLPIVYQDSHLVVINKPHDLLSVPAKDTSLPNAHCLISELLNQHTFVVHRLDMSTSGLLIFALTKPALLELQRQFREREVQKTYECLVIGNPKAQQGAINAPMKVDWPNRPKQAVNYLQGKTALTRWKKLSSNSSFSRLELYPHTGRSHQLRVHLMHIKHAIIGDELYADAAASRGRLMLHAKKLAFRHPDSKTDININIDAPF